MRVRVDAKRPAPRKLVPVLDVYRGSGQTAVALEAASNEKERFYVNYALGAVSFARGNAEQARTRFERCVDLGFPFEMEHDLAVWHLSQF